MTVPLAPSIVGNRLSGKHYGSRPRAFTLVELLVVMGILVILIGFLTPAITTILRGSQLTQSAQIVTDQLNFARQTALAKNIAVEVRFYRFGDPSIPGESTTDPSTGHYRAFQLFAIRDTGVAVALGKVQRLLPTVIIDCGNGNNGADGTTLSSLVDLAATSTMELKLNPQPPIPGVGSYVCCAFRYQPNGSTNLSTTSKNAWFVTIHNLVNGDGLAKPPANFSTIQVDASSGHTRNYRP